MIIIIIIILLPPPLARWTHRFKIFETCKCHFFFGWAWPSHPSLLGLGLAFPIVLLLHPDWPSPFPFGRGLAFLPPRRGLETPTLPSFTLESGFFHRAWPSPFPLLRLAFPSCPFWLGLAWPVPFPVRRPFPFLLAWPSHPPSKAVPSFPFLVPAWKLQFCLPLLLGLA